IVEEWSSIEVSPGSFDWSSVGGVIDTMAARGARVTLCLRSENPLYRRDADGIPDGAWLQAWTALLRSAVRTFGTRIDTIEVGDRPDTGFDPAAYAFVLKSAALAIKAEAKALNLDIRVA